MRQLVLDLMPEAAPSFDNFVAGSNAETLTGLAAWLAPGNDEPVLLLWGEAGAGKTHLLRACTTAGMTTCMTSCFDCRTDPDLAGLSEEEHAFYAIDEVGALSEAGQIRLFNLFNHLRTQRGRLLVAACQPPAQLRLREDLRTRLGSGLVYRLHALSESEKIAALAAQAAARGLRLPPGALDYLLARAPRDMRSLAALLVALDRYSLENKRAITLPLLREVLRAPQESSCSP